jgi:hypothetical protein
MMPNLPAENSAILLAAANRARQLGEHVICTLTADDGLPLSLILGSNGQVESIAFPVPIAGTLPTDGKEQKRED